MNHVVRGVGCLVATRDTWRCVTCVVNVSCCQCVFDVSLLNMYLLLAKMTTKGVCRVGQGDSSSQKMCSVMITSRLCRGCVGVVLGLRHGYV